jgi:hypothetical protein
MRLGVDYSERAPSWPAFARALVSSGRTFVGRYLADPLPYWEKNDKRVLTIEEAEALAAEDVSIFVWWENSPGHVAADTEWRATRGFEAGAYDARKAVEELTRFGVPGAVIYFTIDKDCDPLSTIPYFQGARSVLPQSQMAAYGGYRQIKALFDHGGLITYACQTEAWSRFLPDGRMSGKGELHWDPRAQLRQWTVTRPGYPGTIGGLACDGLDALVEDFGQWIYGEEDDMTAEEYKALKDSSAKNGYRSAIGTAVEIGWNEEAKRLNDEFYKRWPRTDAAGNTINSSGLPVGWAPTP